ncbi:uncharacterized protein PSFLO_07247 [Pseudozyma flocculosa]|uniref:Uncharacterized protein n=1 Tax=Pseudozyma flocculosa TaxID=84751 RepID=A0A5C3FDK1_9BASI|nr:uncharacterized protein PSFLO_07247 [Pseudozyma flocculosa]
MPTVRPEPLVRTPQDVGFVSVRFSTSDFYDQALVYQPLVDNVDGAHENRGTKRCERDSVGRSPEAERTDDVEKPCWKTLYGCWQKGWTLPSRAGVPALVMNELDAEYWEREDDGVRAVQFISPAPLPPSMSVNEAWDTGKWQPMLPLMLPVPSLTPLDISWLSSC